MNHWNLLALSFFILSLIPTMGYSKNEKLEKAIVEAYQKLQEIRETERENVRSLDRAITKGSSVEEHMGKYEKMLSEVTMTRNISDSKNKQGCQYIEKDAAKNYALGNFFLLKNTGELKKLFNFPIDMSEKIVLSKDTTTYQTSSGSQSYKSEHVNLLYCPNSSSTFLSSSTDYIENKISSLLSVNATQVSDGIMSYYLTKDTNSIDVLLSFIHEIAVKFDSGLIYKNGNPILNEMPNNQYCTTDERINRIKRYGTYSAFRAFVKEEEFLSRHPSLAGDYYKKFPIYNALKTLRTNKNEKNCMKAFNTFLSLMTYLSKEEKEFLKTEINDFGCVDNSQWRSRDINGSSNSGPRPPSTPGS